MIPEYLHFIRFQDKRIIPYLYFITLILLGFYWKNNGYSLAQSDAWAVSAVLTLILFGFIAELKHYWAYKCVMKSMDFSYFAGRTTSRIEIVVTHPLVACFASSVLFYLAIRSCLALLSPHSAALCIALISPLVIYLLFKGIRHSYVKQVGLMTARRIKYRNLHRYVSWNIAVTWLTSGLIVSPLRANSDFSLAEGVFSPRLMVAMLILCAIVLAINLCFVRPTRRYHFLARMFLKEIDFDLSPGNPLPSLHEKPLWARLALVLVVETVWILLVSLMLSLAGWRVCFEAYFILCVLPCAGYFYLHAYWLWHNDFMTSCDMFLRCDSLDKKSRFW